MDDTNLGGNVVLNTFCWVLYKKWSSQFRQQPSSEQNIQHIDNTIWNGDKIYTWWC